MKKKKIKKNRIVLIFCTILVCLCSVISFIPFKQEKLVVSADVYVSSDIIFESSNFFIPFDADYIYFNSSGNIARNNRLSFPTVIQYATTSNYVFSQSWYYNYLFKIKLFENANGELMCSMPFNLNSDLSIGYKGYVIKNSSTYSYGDSFKLIDFRDATVYFVGYDYISGTDNGVLSNMLTYGISSWILYYDNFNYRDIVSVRISSGLNSAGNLNVVTVRYIDSAGVYLQFSFYSESFNSDLSTRTYYVTPSDLTDNQYYQEGYSAGQTNGYNTGYNVGQSEGYNQGYNVGQNVGYNSGYTAGSEDSNQYTFLNLVSATIDAPVKYFQSLFNFELLGVNLQGFLTGLFTLCVIVTVVKLCLGG